VIDGTRERDDDRSMSARGLAVLLSLVMLGCSDSGSDPSADSGASETGSPHDGEAPPPGPAAEGWQSAFLDGGVGFSCDDDEATLISKGAPTVGVGESNLYVGFEQIGDNQNPLFARFDAGAQIYCRRHETEPPDGRALGLTWDGGDAAYVVYTIVGGGSSLEGKGGWLSAYAPGSISGGGPKVSVVGKVASSSGELERASFILAVKSDNKVNSHGPRAAPTVLADGNIEFLGASAHKPIDASIVWR
jgi:hypothetical protein